MNRGFRGRSSERGPSGYNYNLARPIMSHEHGQNFTTEKERLSVFDRLGSRGGVSSGGGGGGSNYSDFSTKGRRQLASSITSVRRPPTEGERISQQSSRYEQDSYATYERTSRNSRSKSPGYRGRMDPESRRNFERQGHKEDFKSKEKETRKPKRKGHSSSKSKKTGKHERKTEVSSSDSPSKSGTSSTSKSGSSSSSASEASDSNSDCSSSESSAPSIKLKTGKSKGVSENQPGSKERRSKEVKKAIGSSSSSIVSTSTKHEGHKTRGNERGDSPYVRDKEREYVKERDYDRRSNLPPKSRDYPYSHGSGSIEHEKERSQYPRHSAVDMPGRKRQNSVESYGSAGKRSRRYTPTAESYKSSGRHSPGPRRITSPESLHEKKRYAPEAPRRITPPGGYADKMRRERSPPPSVPERIRIISSKHSHYDDAHRREDRYDDRPRDNRGRQFSPSYGNVPYDTKEGRPRERLAPARSSPARGRPPPEQGFDSPRTARRAPLLPFPPSVEAQPQRFGYQQGGQSQHREFPGSPGLRRGNPEVPVRKQGPPLSRVKDFERGGRQSMVDSWVDETVVKDPNRPALLPTPTCAPYTHPPAVRTEVTPGRAHVGKTISASPAQPASSEKKADSWTKTETLEEVLSDFSDDAEDLLSEAPAGTEKPLIESSEAVPINKDVAESDAVAKTEFKDTEESSSQNATNRVANDVDMLDEFDLEEISDDELGDAERKAGIVDALGVDWSSLVNTQKVKNESPTEIAEEGGKKVGLRECWYPANRFKSSGLPRALFGEQLFNKVYDEIQTLEQKDGVKPEERTTREELEYPSLRLKRIGRSEFLRKIGVMSSHTAYTRKRDEGLRRFLLHRPQVPPGGLLEFPQISSVEEDEETDLDIFRKSVALLKETMIKC